MSSFNRDYNAMMLPKRPSKRRGRRAAILVAKLGGGALGIAVVIAIGAALLAAYIAIAGAFWGWIVMLAWPLFSDETIGYDRAFWMGCIVALVLAALSGSSKRS